MRWTAKYGCGKSEEDYAIYAGTERFEEVVKDRHMKKCLIKSNRNSKKRRIQKIRMRGDAPIIRYYKGNLKKWIVSSV